MLLAAGVPAEEILQQLPPREVSSGHGAEEEAHLRPPAAAPPSAADPPPAAPAAPPASGGDKQRTHAEMPRAILALKKKARVRVRG